MLAHTPVSGPVPQLWDADGAATDPRAHYLRANTRVSAVTRSTTMVEQLVDAHHTRKAEREQAEQAHARREDAVARAAAACDAYHAAKAADDQAAALDAVRELGMWWFAASTHGATPADINAARRGGAQ